MLCPTFWRYSCVLAALILLQGRASAVVLNWGNVSWADGSQNNTYQVDPADPDSVVTFDLISNNGAGFVNYTGSSTPTPAVIQAFEGGTGSPQNALVVAINLSDSATQSITLNVSFAASGGASDVSFTLFDIDSGGGAQDQLSQIMALSIDGSTLIAPTITTNPDNLLIGAGLGQSVVGTGNTNTTGGTSGRGNVTIDFGTNLIQSFTFTFGNTTAFANPPYQHFAMHDLNFTAVPEINPALLSVLSCGLAAGLALRQRRRARPKID